MEEPDRRRMPDPDAPSAAPGESSEIRCLCGYDLTSQAIGGNCPECGRLIAQRNLLATGASSGWAIAALVLGILALLGCACYGVLALPCGVMAIIFARLAKKQIEEGRASPASRPMATAGFICGLIGLILGLITVVSIACFAVFVSQQAKKAQQQQLQNPPPWAVPAAPAPAPAPTPGGGTTDDDEKTGEEAPEEEMTEEEPAEEEPEEKAEEETEEPAPTDGAPAQQEF